MTNKFLFSIIMNVNNVEDYIKDSIESIINQNLNFKDNIQLIIVDSNSIDNSMSIASSYQKKHPENIVCISCDSESRFDAYNLGLEYVTGDYVNFMEGFDVLSPNLISNVKSSFDKHNTNIISYPAEFVDSKKKYPLKFKFDDEDFKEFVDLKRLPECIQLDVHTSFIKKEIIGDLKFSNKIPMADALFINELLIENNHYAMNRDTLYLMQERPEEEITSKSEIFDSFNYFFKRLIEDSIAKYSAVPKFIQHTFLYYLQNIVQIEDIKSFFSSDEELDQFWKGFLDILYYVDMNEIINDEIIQDSVKNFLKFVKNDDFHIECKGKEVFVKSKNDIINTLHKRKLWFDIVEIKDGFLNISGSFQSNCDKQFISVEAIKSGKNIKTVFEATAVEYPNTNRRTKYFLSIPWHFTYNFDFKIPIDDNPFSVSFRTIYQENDDRAVMDSEVTCRYYVNLSEIGNYYRKDNKILLLKKNVIYIRPESYLRAIVYEFKVMMKLFFTKFPLVAVFKTIAFRALCFILYPFFKNKKIWLFSDRRDLSGDNGEHFFRYAMTRKDDVKKYFVIESDSEDYTRLKEIYGKNVVEFKSVKHRILYAFAKKLMQSQISPLTYNPLHEPRPRRFAGLGLAEVYFLQHGVNRYDMSSWITKFDKNLSLILTVSDLDYKEFLSDHYSYDNSIVQLLGYPRFDNLTNENLKKQIVIMPTWRNYIKTANQLINSEYYKRFNGLLNNEKLIEHAKKTGYEIILKPHPSMFKFINVFDVHDYVKVDNETKHHVLLCDSALMITDYSSVANDFVYLKKPVIYYQYGGGKDHHFDITTTFVKDGSMNFGAIIDDEEELIDKIIEYMYNNCEMEEIYKNRVDNFFKYTDRNNSKRVYDWIYTH